MGQIKPYEQEGSKKEQVARMFDNIASKYDFLNRFLSMGIDKRWRKKAVQKLQASQPVTVLDLATGTGDVAIEIVRQIPGARVTGVDISQKMLDIGEVKLRKRKLDQQIVLLYGDSENLNLEDNSFDAATVAFGVRNFENLEKGLREINRVLKPGGKIVVLEFSKPRIFPLKQIFNSYFKYILPAIGKITSKDPKAYKYLYESVQVFPDYHRFTSVLEDCGFKNTKYKSLTAGICCIYEGEKQAL